MAKSPPTCTFAFSKPSPLSCTGSNWLNADLASGIRVNLETYLSARHHNEAWVKGGYILIDELPFIKSPGLDKVMDYLTLKVGDMELDYGDAHY